MHLNRGRPGDDAVSSIVAIIMMVATTVILVAAIFVFLSDMGTRSDEPPKFISLTSQGMLVGGVKTYVIAQGLPPGVQWSHVTVTLNGKILAMSANPCTLAPAVGEFQPCSPALESAASTMDAGDTLRVAAATGDILRLIDPSTKSVMAAVTVV